MKKSRYYIFNTTFFYIRAYSNIEMSIIPTIIHYIQEFKSIIIALIIFATSKTNSNNLNHFLYSSYNKKI